MLSHCTDMTNSYKNTLHVETAYLSIYSLVRYLLQRAQEKQNRCQCLLRAIKD